MNREPEDKNLTSAVVALQSDGDGDLEERVIEIHKSGVMSEDRQFAPLINMMELASLLRGSSIGFLVGPVHAMTEIRCSARAEIQTGFMRAIN